MVARGVKPSDGPKRFRGQPHTEWVEVPNTPYEGDSPDLPDAVDWPEQTVEWYEVVRHLPHARLWGPGEWQEVLTTALVHASVWRDPADPPASKITELRAREKAIGLTADQRRDLRIRYLVPVERRDEPDDDESDKPVMREGPTTHALET